MVSKASQKNYLPAFNQFQISCIWCTGEGEQLTAAEALPLLLVHSDLTLSCEEML